MISEDFKMEVMVGIKFILRHGTYVSAIVPEEAAKNIIGHWMEGTLIRHVGSVTPPEGGWMWAVQVEAIEAIHTFKLEQSPPIKTPLAPVRWS